MDITALKKFVPFSELDDKYLEDALTHITQKTYHKGDMIFKRGRAIGERFYLVSGRVDLIDASFQASALEADRGGASSSALNPESPTRCSCISKSLVKVFSIESEALDRIVAWSQSAASVEPVVEEQTMLTGEIEVSSIADEEATDWMSSLLQSPLFTRIPLTQVQELFLRFEDIAIEQGEVIVKEGEKGDYFYVLASGLARVTNRSESVDVLLDPGHYFGEEALLGDTPRNATVTMVAAGKVKRLNAEDFASLLKAPILKYIEEKDLEGLKKPYKMLDVKMPLEFRMNHIPGCINVPLARLRTSIKELAKSYVYVVPDDAGSRADIAAHLLCQAGFDAYILSATKAAEDE